jgi:hypothetical protein
MSKSRKKNKDRFEKKKIIAFKNKNKEILEQEKEDENEEAEEILLRKLRQENITD